MVKQAEQRTERGGTENRTWQSRERNAGAANGAAIVASGAAGRGRQHGEQHRQQNTQQLTTLEQQGGNKLDNTAGQQIGREGIATGTVRISAKASRRFGFFHIFDAHVKSVDGRQQLASLRPGWFCQFSGLSHKMR
jgi:hypothetical protein